MTEHPEGYTPPDDDDDDDERSDEPASPDDLPPVQGQLRHSNLSALVPEGIGTGVFSNGVMILTGQFEIVLDFVLRMGEQQRVVARCILPRYVAGQLSGALQDNVKNYESRFGPLPPIPKPLSPPEPATAEEATATEPQHPENAPAPPPAVPQIQDLYDELKIPDDVMCGRYANAVLIRHSATEFCFDFITNFYPRSGVSARVFLAAPHVRPFLGSLQRSLNPPGTGQEFA